MSIESAHNVEAPIYKHLSMFQYQTPDMFAQDSVQYKDPFLRTLDLIYSVKPFVGIDKKLHLDFSNTEATVWCLEMKRSILEWKRSKFNHDDNDEIIISAYGRIKPVELFESGQIIEGTLDAMFGINYWCPTTCLHEFINLPYLDTLDLMNKNAFIYDRENSDEEKIYANKEILCNLFRESLEKWPARDKAFTQDARNLFFEKKVHRGISSMMYKVKHYLSDKCWWGYDHEK